MPRMKSRQENILIMGILLLVGFSACTPSGTQITPTLPPTATVTASPVPPTATPSPIPVTPSPTPFICSGSGQVKQDVVSVTDPPQEFLIYLPPCYDSAADRRFPTLYLLHGMTYNKDQWVRLGASSIADQLISSGEFPPFIIVMPDDPYWNTAPGPGFGTRLMEHVIPYVDENYRTLAGRENRALGGLSRGAGWTIELGLNNPTWFGALGIHSPAVSAGTTTYLSKVVRGIKEEDRPLLWMDIGDNDKELPTALIFEQILTANGYLHEFYRNAGDHSEDYWSAHTEEYLRWYASHWLTESSEP